MKYFQHNTQSFQDEKITQLFINFGYEGLGLFYTILEKLAYQESPLKTEVLKSQLKIGKKLGKIWKFLEEIELISTKNGETFNKNIEKFAGNFKIKKEKNRKRIEKFRANQALTKNVTHYKNSCNAYVTPINKELNKELNIKEKEIKEIYKEKKEKEENFSGNYKIIPNLLKNNDTNKNEFEKARKLYPGTKKGLEVEYSNFKKKYHLTEMQELIPAIKAEIKDKEKRRASGVFCPEWKNFSTWINQACWKQEFEIIRVKNGNRTNRLTISNIEQAIAKNPEFAE